MVLVYCAKLDRDRAPVATWPYCHPYRRLDGGWICGYCGEQVKVAA